MPGLHYRNYAGITDLARDLRKNQTPQEKIVWSLLRKKQFCDYKFLRQHPVFYREDKGWVDFYIADFYCNKLKLIIEVDGKIHETRMEYDKERDEKLLAKGILVERILNEFTEDITKLNDCLKSIIENRALYIANNHADTPPSLIL
jgi:very-short-patch-repair endonuclease